MDLVNAYGAGEKNLKEPASGREWKEIQPAVRYEAEHRGWHGVRGKDTDPF